MTLIWTIVFFTGNFVLEFPSTWFQGPGCFRKIDNSIIAGILLSSLKHKLRNQYTGKFGTIIGKSCALCVLILYFQKIFFNIMAVIVNHHTPTHMLYAIFSFAYWNSKNPPPPRGSALRSPPQTVVLQGQGFLEVQFFFNFLKFFK